TSVFSVATSPFTVVISPDSALSPWARATRSVERPVSTVLRTYPLVAQALRATAASAVAASFDIPVMLYSSGRLSVGWQCRVPRSAVQAAWGAIGHGRSIAAAMNSACDDCHTVTND